VELIASIGQGPVALDSAIFIYLIEQHARYAPLLRPLFEHIDRGDIPAVTSALTLLETLVVPYRSGNPELAARYEAILTRGRGLTLDRQLATGRSRDPRIERIVDRAMMPPIKWSNRWRARELA
jgi:predicted nucleic acid-binding protein